MASMFGIDERRIPGHRVGHAVDVVPAAGVEADEARAERGADLHQLEAGLELLDQHVGLDRAVAAAPSCCSSAERMSCHSAASSAVWIFGRYSTSEEPRRAARAWLLTTYSVASTIEAEKPAPSAWRTWRSSRCRPRARKIFVVKSSWRRQSSMIAPAEEALRPRVHLAGHLLGHAQEQRVAVDRELQVALVVERHRRELAERVLAVEHPAVGARQQRVGDVADALLQRGVGLGRRAGALDPLALQVVRESRCPRTRRPARLRTVRFVPGNASRRDRERRCAAVARPRRAPLDARRHQLAALRIERRQRVERRDGLARVDVVVGGRDPLLKFQHAHILLSRRSRSPRKAGPPGSVVPPTKLGRGYT